MHTEHPDYDHFGAGVCSFELLIVLLILKLDFDCPHFEDEVINGHGYYDIQEYTDSCLKSTLSCIP
jgi:hypothetical protein